MLVEPFKISDEAEADEYLEALSKNSEYWKIYEVESRAERHAKDVETRNYLVSKAREMLNT
jgi:hypothetical protein